MGTCVLFSFSIVLLQQDTAASSTYIVRVDPRGHVLYWRPEDYSKVCYDANLKFLILDTELNE